MQLRKVLVIILSFSLVWGDLTLAATRVIQGIPPPDDSTIQENIDATLGRLERLNSLLDHSLYDLDVLLEAQDFEAKRIVDYVRTEIRYQAYAGVLRGPEGTLRSRSGNALDQSLLLAKLLKDAGNEARIVRGRLSEQQSMSLVKSLAGAAQWPPALVLPDAAEKAWELLNPGSPVPVSEGLTTLLKEIKPASDDRNQHMQSTGKAISDTLTRAGYNKIDSSFAKTLIEEQRDYFWVEYRLEPTGAWTSAHPTFGSSPPDDLVVVRYFKEEIPAELQHRVRFQAFVETQTGNAAEIHPLMSPWERPAASAALVPQTLMLMPITQFEKDGRLDLEAGLAKAKFFGLYLNRSLAPGANVFTLGGLVGPPDALTGPGEFIAEVAGKGKTAADALTGLGSSAKSPPTGLKRVWFEYTIIAPGGKERTIRREILSTMPDGGKLINGILTDPDNWQEKARLALAQSRELVVATGPVSPAYALANVLSDAQSARKTLSRLTELQRDGRLSASPDLLADLEPLPDPKVMKFLSMATGSMGFEADGSTFLVTPMLVTFNRGLKKTAGMLRQYEQTDIVFNARRSVVIANGVARAAPDNTIRQGVWDTYTESVVGTPTCRQSTKSSAYSMLTEHPEELQYLAPNQASELDRMGFSSTALHLARSELNSGYGLILSPGTIDDPAWWRVDPESGTVTGMMVGPGGYGGATATEYMIFLSIGVGTLLMYWSFFNCYETESGLSLFCCLVDSWLTGMIVAAFAFVIGMLGGLAIGAGEVAVTGAAVASAEAEMVAAIINFFILDGISTVISFTDFRIKACETATGPSGPPPPPPPGSLPVPRPGQPTPLPG